MHENLQMSPASNRANPCRPGPNVLLVSRDEAWLDAVSSAAQQLGGDAVVTGGGRDALARLAGSVPHYSHLLVEHAAAEGVFNELADLAGEVTFPDIDVLVLGMRSGNHPRLRAIQAASAHLVREALMAGPPARESADIDIVDLQAALDGAHIEARYQPIVRLADRFPVGLEALARLHHPKLGVILPDRFVPMIEAAGLAGRLTDLVSTRAFSDMAGVAVQDRDLTLSLNFPLDVILSADALDRLEASRAAAGIPADRVIIELTESRPVEDVVTLRRSLERLRELGYGAAIDDVGPAVPRLAPLLQLPFTSLKLDKDMVQQVLTSVDVAGFLRRTIDSAKAHNLTVVAEGVETPDIWAAMSACGADHAQGFLASRPLPLAAVPIWLDRWV